MPENALELADRIWRGDASIADHPPFAYIGELVEIGAGTAFVPSFANVSAFDTGAGLVLVDTGSPMLARQVHGQLRAWSDKPLHTAIYSHGHIDHVFGVGVFEEEAAARGQPAPRVVAHEAVPARFDRYKHTAGYNSIINQRQFQTPGLRWPTDYRYPDETFAETHVVEVGGERFELRHARGETDDHTWTWVPARKVLCPGDLFIWALPNAGNPQKVQRYPMEWAEALREMAKLKPEFMLPGHGLPIVGAERVQAALTDTASLLESLHGQTLALMNEGARLDEIIQTVQAPAELLEKPYLKPTYDEAEFIVQNLWRQYGGWYDGNPASLKPAPAAALASELAALAGGANRLAARALDLAKTGELRLAGHLAELAVLAAPDDAKAHAARAEVFEQRAATETSVMARGIFGWTASESRRMVSESQRRMEELK